MTTEKKLIKTYSEDGSNFVATICLHEREAGYVAEWWISCEVGSTVLVMGNVIVPVYGYDSLEAMRKALGLSASVIDLVKSTWGGEASLVRGPDSDVRVEIAKAMIERHVAKGIFEGCDLLSRTFQMALVARQLNIPNHAQVIAEVEGVNVRAIHERVQRYRREGSPLF